MKSIALVDDHVVIRNGLKELIEKLGPYKVTHQFDNGWDCVQAIPQKVSPDLIIMDIEMPEMTGDEALEIFKNRGLKIPVLILTLNTDEDMLLRLYKLGMRGFLHKNCTASVLKEALTEIFASGFYYNQQMNSAYHAKKADNVKSVHRSDLLAKLSPREKEFMKLLCNEEEFTYQEIANRMSVNFRTVDGYRQTIFDKLGVKSKTGIVFMALKHNLLDDL